jgi:hypothetical protein
VGKKAKVHSWLHEWAFFDTCTMLIHPGTDAADVIIYSTSWNRTRGKPDQRESPLGVRGLGENGENNSLTRWTAPAAPDCQTSGGRLHQGGGQKQKNKN